MAVERYTGNHKGWDHVGNLTPIFEHSESIRPHFPSKVAPWLPVNTEAASVSMGFMSRYDVRDEDYVVVSSGKVVAVCATPSLLGGLLPAGVRKAWADAGGGDTVLTYTALDVTNGVIDLGTGATVTAATTYTKTALTLQLQQQGLLSPGSTLDAFVSLPVGFASMNYWKSAGLDLDNPSTFAFHNYKMMDRAPIVCDYVIRLPHVPSDVASSNMVAFDDTFVLTNLDDEGSDGIWGSVATFKTQMDRYDAVSTSNAVGYSTGFAPAAANTTRTPLAIASAGTDITSTVLIRGRSNVDALVQDGDYFWDAEVGVLWMYELAGNALPTNLTAGDDLTFYHYRSVPTSVTTFASAVGNLEPGDFVTYDTNSNLVKADTFTSSDIATSSDGNPSDAELAVMLNQVVSLQNETLGQVFAFRVHPQDYLDRVRTAYSTLGMKDQMPGSASGGYPDTVTYASAADREVIINLIKR